MYTNIHTNIPKLQRGISKNGGGPWDMGQDPADIFDTSRRLFGMFPIYKHNISNMSIYKQHISNMQATLEIFLKYVYVFIYIYIYLFMYVYVCIYVFIYIYGLLHPHLRLLLQAPTMCVF